MRRHGLMMRVLEARGMWSLPIRDEAYRAWVGEKPCLVCSTYNIAQIYPTESAHCGPHGLGVKASDETVVPLCGLHHREHKYALDRVGSDKFHQLWGIDVKHQAQRLRREYLNGKANG